MWYIISILTLSVLTVGKFLGYHYTDDTAMTLAIANSLVRQPRAAVDVHQFDAKDMANGYSFSSVTNAQLRLL